MIELIEFIADYYGRTKQEIKTLEELNELKEELYKNIFCEYPTENTLTEIADVLIMVSQLVYLYDIKEEVEKEVEYKLIRQYHRIEKEVEGHGKTIRMGSNLSNKKLY